MNNSNTIINNNVTMMISPVHEDNPIDNVENGKKYWKENKEEEIHSCSAHLILHKNNIYCMKYR